eukprot:symbB.v1.2.037375.t1/scaffold5502.1/size38168/3
MCAGVSSFGFGGTNSRADLWADVEKGPFKDGTQTELSPAEGAKWIKRILDSESTGTQYQVVQQLGVQHKKGH